MLIPQTLTSELSNTSAAARSRRRFASMTLCMLGLLGSAVACNGKIDENQDTGSARPSTNQPADGAGARAPSAPTVRGNAGDDADPSDVSASERGLDDDLDRTSAGSRSNAGGRRSGGRDRDERDDEEDEELVDAGVLDAGEADAGEADAGVLDADAGEPDAGLNDAGIAP